MNCRGKELKSSVPVKSQRVVGGVVMVVRGEEMAGMYAGVGWDASRERSKGGVIHNVHGWVSVCGM